MRNFLLAVITIFSATIVSAQQVAPSPNTTPPASPDVENLRQQVQALTETVKALQQQMRDQQTAIEKANGTAPSPAASAPPTRFATEDASVVSSTSNAPTAPSGPSVNANGTATSGSFPTTDTSVVSSAPETISSTGTGASLTQPISIGGGKNYM